MKILSPSPSLKKGFSDREVLLGVGSVERVAKEGEKRLHIIHEGGSSGSKEGAKNPKRKESLCGSRKGLFSGHEEEGTVCCSAGVEVSKEGAKNPKRKESLCGSRKGLFSGHEEEGTVCCSAGVEVSKEGAKNPSRKESLCGSRKGLFSGHEEEGTECCSAGVEVSTQRKAKLSGWEEVAF